MNAIDPNAGTGTHDAILRDKPDPVHAGPLKSWREAEARVRADEPAPFRPGNPVFMAGWRSCQQQAAELAASIVSSWSIAAGEEVRAAIAAMRPEAPR